MKRLVFLTVLFISFSLNAQDIPGENVYSNKLQKLCFGDTENSGIGAQALLNSDLVFEIKKKGVETENPVDEFVEFLDIYGIDSTRIYFLVSIKSAKYEELRAIAEHEGRGRIFSFYFKSEDGFKYLIETSDPYYLLNSLINSQNWSLGGNKPFYTLAEGERVFFIANGMIPKIQIDVLYKGTHASTYFIEDIPLYGNTFFIRDKSENVDFALGKNDLKNADKIIELFNQIGKNEQFETRYLNSFLAFMTQPNAEFKEKFDSLSVKFMLWGDECLRNDVEYPYYSIALMK